jgi:hypothetical protein
VEFRKSKLVSLKAHYEYNEKWLQALLVDDPSLLGLGDLVVKDVERRQPHAGRLDLLLSDPETDPRYEVEIQLGATDERHIIRTSDRAAAAPRVAVPPARMLPERNPW